MQIQKTGTIGKQISIIYRQALVYLNKKLSDIDLSYSEYITLIHIEENKAFNQKHLADLLVIDKALITRAIKSLEEKGYIKREKNPEDKRAYNIILTSKGVQMQPIILKTLMGWNDIITEGMNKNEKDFILERLKQMSSNALKKTKEN